jgi:hypothetical protein
VYIKILEVYQVRGKVRRILHNLKFWRGGRGVKRGKVHSGTVKYSKVRDPREIYYVRIITHKNLNKPVVRIHFLPLNQ